MEKSEIIRRLKKIASHAVHAAGEKPFVMSLDDGIAVSEVLELLKKQEPASPTWEQGKAYCGKCGQRLPRKRADREIHYCSYCGQEVKWNG